MRTFTYIVLGIALTISSSSYSQTKGCSTVQPKLTFHLDTTTRGLADNYYLWNNGQTIRVKFLSGSPALQQQIKNIAREWENHANLRFEFVTDGDANIRVNLDNKGGHNSLIGILANMIDPAEKTMNYDTTDFRTYDAMRRTVLHEFGHAIGLLHEHYSPLAGIPWNKELVYKELAQTQGWDKETVDVNLFQEYKVTYTNGTQYDKVSIMHYPVLARWTTNGYAVNWNNDLSAGDKALVAALYPKIGERSREVPRFVVSDYSKMEVVKNDAKQGLSLFPSFNITTAGKEGKVYFTVFFYDMEGKPIMDNDNKYNISNVVATFKSFALLPDKKLSANKLQPQDFELFIPYAELPLPAGTNNVQAVFKAFLVDGEEFKVLYSSKPVSFSIVK